MTAYQAVREELNQVRTRQREIDVAKMTTRIKKREKQRVWAIEEIIRSNAENDEPIRCRRVKRTRKSLVIAIRLPLDAYTSLNLEN
jgi:hypothetical protein